MNPPSMSPTSMSPTSMSPTTQSFYDMFNTFFTVLGALTSGIVLGFTIVSYMVYDKNYKYEEEDDEEDDDDEEDKYCLKFFDELENLPERELEKEELEELRLKTLEEETPEGQIIMSYNSDTESFWYYANSTSVPYSSLDAVARLYAVTYNCKSICINYKEEWEKGKEKASKEKELDLKKREEEEQAPKPKSIFAKFKGYNKKNGSDDEKKKYYIITEKANKFKYKGKISEFINTHITKDVNPNSSLTDAIAPNELAQSDAAPNELIAQNESAPNELIPNESSLSESTIVIDKKKIDYSTFKKIYREKNN
jgi:hypothetical protein